MRFLILGGTGPSGIELIRKTLEVHPDAFIVVYARSPDKIPEDLRNHAAVTVIKGTLEDLDTVETAVQGVDVVLSALGPLLSSPANTPIATFYGHLIDLLYKYNIKRILALSTASSPDPHDTYSWKYATLVKAVKTMFNNPYQDIVACGDVFRNKGKDLDWTLVRVPVLTSADTDGVIAGHVGDKEVGMVLSRKAFAAFCLGEVEKREWVRDAAMICNA